MTDDRGLYEFGGLSTDSSITYDVGVTYQGVDYWSHPIQLTTANSTQTADLTVYETTNSNANVQVAAGRWYCWARLRWGDPHALSFVTVEVFQEYVVHWG